MKIVIQRVRQASVSIDNKIKSSINKGLLVLVGIGNSDDKSDIEWLCNKIANLRIFDDKDGIMNLSLLDVDGDIIVVSQFTLQANTKKGHRPSYIDAAKPEFSIPLYEAFVHQMELIVGKEVQTGTFGAHMEVSLVNDGPVTIVMDSKNK